MVPEGKLVIADDGYDGDKHDDWKKLSLKNPMDPKELKRFKSRARCRHETFNGRMKHFKILSDIYRHDQGKHEYAFVAVAVFIQYQMENGHPLFDV